QGFLPRRPLFARGEQGDAVLRTQHTEDAVLRAGDGECRAGQPLLQGGREVGIDGAAHQVGEGGAEDGERGDQADLDGIDRVELLEGVADGGEAGCRIVALIGHGGGGGADGAGQGVGHRLKGSAGSHYGGGGERSGAGRRGGGAVGWVEELGDDPGVGGGGSLSGRHWRGSFHERKGNIVCEYYPSDNRYLSLPGRHAMQLPGR